MVGQILILTILKGRLEARWTTSFLLWRAMASGTSLPAE